MIRRLRMDDRGTSLLIVLMIVTLVSVVIGVILSQEDTSVKATEVLQDQSAADYGADAAAQAFVTQLKNGQFLCSGPSASTLLLGSGPSSPFYRPVGAASGAQNAVATCAPDTTTGVTSAVTGSGTMVGPANTPSASITTVGVNAADGIIAGATLSPFFSLCVQGSVLTSTTFTGSVKAGKNSGGSATACPDTTSSATTVKAFGTSILYPIVTGCSLGLFPITPCTPLGGTPVPAIPTLPDPGLAITKTNTDQPATCLSSGGKVYAAFLPGLYDTVTATKAFALSTPCNLNGSWVAANVDWFSPGVYYFSFPGATTFTLPATVVGGTPAKAGTNGQTPISGLNPTVASTLSNLSQMGTGEGKCIPPTAQTVAGEGGVEFVFGGASTMTGVAPPFTLLPPASPSTDFDICATYSATSPPVAIYGVQHALTAAPQVLPESGCVATPGCGGAVNSILNWPVSPILGYPVDQTFHIDGYVWAPTAAMAITYANSNGQAFNWGVLVRSFDMIGVTSLTMANVPVANPGIVTTYTYSVRYVNVWTCAAASSPCPQAGPPDVQIKLQQTGSTWKVLSWSEQR
jgi:hypothetical protein